MKNIQLLLLALLFYCCADEKRISIDAEIVKAELDSIMILDQKYRSELFQLYKEKGGESVEFQRLQKLQADIDSSNLSYVEDLIAKYGKYPGKSLVGHSLRDVAFFVLQHSPDSIQAKYIDIILDAAQDNELNKGSVAMYHDRYLINKGEEQIYGTQIGTKEVIDSITGQVNIISFCYPIRDTASIDSLRLWNGLLDLEGYLNSFGLSRWDSVSVIR